MTRLSPSALIFLTVILGIGFHGSLMPFSMQSTYDAFVHIFFGYHYSQNWFDHWNPAWYTGFIMTSYPPGTHQSIALLSNIFGLKFAFVVVMLIGLGFLISGIFRFSRIWVSKEASAWAGLLVVFSPSVSQTIHVYGQLPTIFSFGLFLHQIYFFYLWLERGHLKFLAISILLVGTSTSSHHVTPLFGFVFFATPIVAKSILKALDIRKMDEKYSSIRKINANNLKPLLVARFRRIYPVLERTLIFGILQVITMIIVIFPYWYLTKTDPISQVPIPHASRNNFLTDLNAGFMFFLVPWGTLLLFLPYGFLKVFISRNWPLALVFLGLVLLGLGGTTPIPKLLLGPAYKILTFDRFTFWASIIILPFIGEFFVSLFKYSVNLIISRQLGRIWVKIVGYSVFALFVTNAVLIANLSHFIPMQPPQIDMNPIANFLSKDEHDKWRYLTLGFGDQMAWLNTKTSATTVDGNYHSARKLPELTSTPIERLEGAKFKGLAGLGSLQAFLTNPESFNLKFIFSNDRFYDPILYFSGWRSLGILENGIHVWQKYGVPTLPESLPRREIPIYHRIHWGIVPMAFLIIGIITIILFYLTVRKRMPRAPTKKWRRPSLFQIDHILKKHSLVVPIKKRSLKFVDFYMIQERLRRRFRVDAVSFSTKVFRSIVLLSILLATLITLWQVGISLVNNPKKVVEDYYDHLNFRRFKEAYNLLHPEGRPEYGRFILDISHDAGLIASYGMLKAGQIEETRITDGLSKIRGTLQWITSLKSQEESIFHRVRIYDGDWKIEYVKKNLKNNEKRLRSSESISWVAPSYPPIIKNPTTGLEHVLDRPEVEILSPALVELSGQLAFVGLIRNIDDDPAGIRLSLTAFNKSGDLIYKNNMQTVGQHVLASREGFPFRIDFQALAGIRQETKFSAIAKSDTHKEIEYLAPSIVSEDIASIKLWVTTGVATTSTTRSLSLQDIRVTNKMFSAVMMNTGTSSIRIPQIFLTYISPEGYLLWVDQQFHDQAVPPYYNQKFDMNLRNLDKHKNINVEILISINGKEAYPKSSYLPEKKRLSIKGHGYKIYPFFQYFGGTAL